MLFSFSTDSERSIRSQVISFMIVGIALMTIIISLVTTAGVNHQSRQLMLDNAFQISEGLAKQVVFALLSGDPENASDAMTQVKGFQSVKAAKIIFTDHSNFLTIGNFPDIIERAQSTLASTAISQETNEYWLIKSPVYVAEQASSDAESEFELEETTEQAQTIGFVEVIYSKEHLSDAQTRVALLVAAVGIVSVLIMGAILRYGLNRLFKPLGQLADTMAEAKNSGEYILASIKGAKEIKNMASSYNLMMKVLKQQDNDLKQHRDHLENEVQVRTLELVSARDEALSASQHKSEFMANMSHELRTPIQSIIGYGELVIEELELEGNFTLLEDMDKIAKNSSRLLLLINSLLDLAKIEAGKTDLHHSEVFIDSIQQNLLDTIKPLAHKNNNSFFIENHAVINKLTTDKEKLEQVLLNLLSNACKFTENGQISLTIANNNESIHFQITDTGIGLTEAQQAYIFDEFRQVDSSQTRKFSGTGLGLAISKRFVTLMGGKISVTSKLNQGATFTVTLPLHSG
ncbi:MAG: sensor histidine kinase [Thalassotalea sp.]